MTDNRMGATEQGYTYYVSPKSIFELGFNHAVTGQARLRELASAETDEEHRGYSSVEAPYVSGYDHGVEHMRAVKLGREGAI
ncbi:MAG: hypothetical protein ACRDFS_02050 [Chloroflexota bacterium]